MRLSFPFATCKFTALVVFFGLSVTQSCLAQTGVQVKGYGKAEYSVAKTGKFMRTWLVAGPFLIAEDSVPAVALQEKAFRTDLLSVVKVSSGNPAPPVLVQKKEFKWQPISSDDDIIDLDKLFGKRDFVYAYALAEIITTSPTNAMLAVGSDDGIKIWLNGKLVHDNWIPRGIVKDNDVVPLQLLKGSNQILLKVQDMQGGWGFTARLLDKAGLSEQLSRAAGGGDIEKVNLLLQSGADVNAATKTGMTPIAAAKIAGRDDVSQLLLKNGAKDTNVPGGEVLVDNLYNSLKGKQAPGIALLVAKDGNVLYKKGFGYADVKNSIPITPHTKFRIGSVTKQFTAAAILKLQERNLLSVNDKLSKFIPDFPRGDEVTIHHLLNHTSGIHSYTGKNDFIGRVSKTISPDSLVAEIKKDSFDFNPAEKMLYNNSGYFILGYIVSKVSGKPYETFLKETFFDPLEMKSTGVHYSGINLQNEARGYTRRASTYDEALNWDMSWAGGAGAIYSTVDDLLKWNQALYGGKVLDKRSLDAALTPAVLKNGEQPPMQYGYGLMLSKYRGTDVISHSGGLHGFLTQLAYYPKEKMTVAMFSNTSEPEANFDPNKVAELFLWNTMEKQISYAESSVKPANLEIYTGRYDLVGQAVITVTTEGGKLYAQLSGQPRFEIFPRSENEFFWKIVDARIKFIADKNGIMSEAILFQNGQELKAKRLPEEKIIQVDPVILDKYVGKYRLNDNIVVTVTKENNKLFAQPTNQDKVEMLALSETNFIVMEINAKITFLKDQNGKVTMFKLNMNGRDAEVPKIE